MQIRLFVRNPVEYFDYTKFALQWLEKEPFPKTAYIKCLLLSQLFKIYPKSLIGRILSNNNLSFEIATMMERFLIFMEWEAELDLWENQRPYHFTKHFLALHYQCIKYHSASLFDFKYLYNMVSILNHFTTMGNKIISNQTLSKEHYKSLLTLLADCFVLTS